MFREGPIAVIMIIVVVTVCISVLIGVIGAATTKGSDGRRDVIEAWCASIGDTQYANGHCFKNGIELKMGAQEDD